MVYGADQPYNVALVVPNWEQLQAWAVENADGIAPISSKKEVGEHPKVRIRHPSLFSKKTA
jgi:long-subunit acyl-CoA synthetase (AMP-forming)